MMGFSMHHEMVRRLAALKRHIAALGLIRTEIAYRNTPMGDILEALIRDCGADTAEFYQASFAAAASGLAFSSAAQQNLEVLKKQGLADGDIESIQAACRVLGQYDAGTQAEHLAAAISRLETNMQMMQKELSAKGRIYKTAGATIGIMLALIVI